MKNDYRFEPHLILRTPARPFAALPTAGTLDANLADAAFREALYLASPVLAEECEKWRQAPPQSTTDPKRQAKVRGALARYAARFSSRCTPFGLFAGCSVVSWGAQSHIVLDPAAHARHTRLDMHYLCALAQVLAARADIRPRLRYWPNSSWYRLGEEIRYIEHHYAHGQLVHEISAIEASEYVALSLAACADGLPYAELVARLAPDPAEQPEATAFVEALIEAQVLVSELEPTVTGVEFLTHIRRVLSRLLAEQPGGAGADVADVANIERVLADVEAQLRTLDARPDHSPNAPADYQRIVAALAPLGAVVEPDKLFQTDAVHGVAAGAATLSEDLQADLLGALDVLACLSPPSESPRLAEFRRQFEARYETREVPLLEALDAESGLAYSAYGRGAYSPLVHELALPDTAAPARAAPLTDVQRFMYRKLRDVERRGEYAVELTAEELRPFQPPATASPSSLPPPLPPSLSVLFRPVADGQLLLDAVGGSSAVNLLGRFAHAEPRIETLVRAITEAEQAHNPAVAFAELCHLPASRIGNILLRPSFRALEIPYLAQSGLPAADQVRPQDLTLRLHQGQLELRSSRTGQRIVPRLSTAHNYAAQALPVYELLADLQTQGLRASLGFRWESVSAADVRFAPRLTCGRVVLAAASWQLDRAAYAELLAAAPPDVPARLLAFRQRWRLPRFFTLADADNELLVDTENELLVQTWLDTIRGRPAIQLKEFLFDPATSPVRDAAGRAYAAQFVALLVRQGPCYPGPAAPTAAALAADADPAPMSRLAPVRREFALGSEWLYYKLYCGPAVANRLLREAIGPLTGALLADGLIDGWFFIRYADPAPHLRLRLHLPDVARLGEVVRLAHDYLAPGLEQGYVWKMQADTYQRELERYGPQSIALVEELFYYQSAALLAHLTDPAGEPATPDEQAYWLWGVRAADELLRAFAYAPAQRLALVRGLYQAFSQEFGLDKALKIQLDAKYRQFRPRLEQTLTDAADDAEPPAPLRALAGRIRQVVADNPTAVPLDALLGACLHMLLNRVLPADARLHELVLYDFLARSYQSALARATVA